MDEKLIFENKMFLFEIYESGARLNTLHNKKHTILD